MSIARWVLPTGTFSQDHDRYAIWALARRRGTAEFDAMVSKWGQRSNPEWKRLSEFQEGSLPLSLNWTRVEVQDWPAGEPHWNQYDRPYSAIMAPPRFLMDLDYLQDLELGGPEIASAFYSEIAEGLTECIGQAIMASIPLLRRGIDPNALVSLAALVIANEIELALATLQDDFGDVLVHGSTVAEQVDEMRELLHIYGRG